METVGRFSELFRGRTDFVGVEEGGCARLYGEGDNFDWLYQGHLTGSRPPIGIYPVVDEYAAGTPIAGVVRKWYKCKFGAIDIDFEDLSLAKNLRLALQALGVTAWVERSRSKGYHVWIFVDGWVPAVLVRSVLQVACEVVSYSPKEIFPKQTELVDGSPGNYIRLPYPGMLGAPGDRRVMLGPDDHPMRLDSWVTAAYGARAKRNELEAAAQWAPKPKAKTRMVRDVAADEDVKALVGSCGPLSYVVWRDGPLEGSDRSGTLLKLAYLLQEDGFTADNAFAILRDADARWGKFYDRSDGETRLWEIIERAYGDKRTES